MADTTPNAFTFTAITGAATSTAYPSNTITVAGVDAATNIPISITGGTYSINNGAYTSSAGNVQLGDKVSVLVTSSGSFSTLASTTLTIETVSATFNVTTALSAVVITPTGLAFTPSAITNAPIARAVETGQYSVGGTTAGAPIPISVTGGMWSVSTDNGVTWSAFTANPGTVVATNRVKAQITTSSNLTATAGTVTLTLNATSASLTATTRNALTAPRGFTFGALANVAVSTAYESNIILIGGLDTGVNSAISIVGGQFAIDPGTGTFGSYTSTATTVKLGDRVKVKVTSSASNNSSVSATLTVDTLKRVFKVTTVAIAVGGGSQTAQDKTSTWTKNAANVYCASTPTYAHGDTVTLFTSYGDSNDVSKGFTGGAGGIVESLATSAHPVNGNGWFYDTVSATGIVGYTDTGGRGKVMYASQSSSYYDSPVGWDYTAEVPPNTYFRFSYWAQATLKYQGGLYDYGNQWKHFRITSTNSIVDSNVNAEMKVHSQHPQNCIVFFNRGNDNSSGGKTQYPGVFPKINTTTYTTAGWALVEVFGYTGSVDGTDGKFVMRCHQNGVTRIILNDQAATFYKSGYPKYRYFINQNYFGNWAEIASPHHAAIDYTLVVASQKPDSVILMLDDHHVMVGNSANGHGWRRVELRDQSDVTLATIREEQDHSVWAHGQIKFPLNVGGLSTGTHSLLAVVIDGIDASGYDIVVASFPISVVV